MFAIVATAYLQLRIVCMYVRKCVCTVRNRPE